MLICTLMLLVSATKPPQARVCWQLGKIRGCGQPIERKAAAALVREMNHDSDSAEMLSSVI